MVSGLTKAHTGQLESVNVEELEKHCIARVNYILAEEEGFQDVLISSDEPLPKRLKTGH